MYAKEGILMVELKSSDNTMNVRETLNNSGTNGHSPNHPDLTVFPRNQKSLTFVSYSLLLLTYYQTNGSSADTLQRKLDLDSAVAGVNIFIFR